MVASDGHRPLVALSNPPRPRPMTGHAPRYPLDHRPLPRRPRARRSALPRAPLDRPRPPGEILSACDALNGILLFGPGRAPAALAVELHDYARLRGLRPEFDVSPERWQERVTQVAEDPSIAAALLVVSSELWLGNKAIEHAIRKSGKAGQPRSAR